MFVTKKKIHEKERFYLEKSIRLLNGKIKKFSLYLKDYNENINLQGYEEKLNKKIEQEQIAFIVSYYEKDYIFDEKLIKELELMKLNYKSIITKLTKKQLEDIIDRFAINFTYESNAIEGNSLTLKDVTILLTEKKVIKRKDLREIYETLNTKEALNLIFENKFKIKKEDIIKLHSIIVKDTGVTIGYKKFPNFLLGRNIKTTSPEFVEKEINELIFWYNNTKMHPLKKAIVFHGKFEKIHPFEDGNGRTGRMLVNIILLNNDYPPIIIRKTHKLSYFSALEAFDNKHQDKLIRFFIEKYKDTYKKFFEIYFKYL
ncbi:MAG TPA: Fic family protein [Candidatus Nanoarchaeia archaeon]|nr:Fic family protein [Candidatus Nanoarchaeia archaeon]